MKPLQTAIFAALLLGATEAAATFVAALPLAELAEQSDLVVVGEVTALEPFLADDGRVYTRVQVTPNGGGEAVVVMQLGGRTEELATRVSGADLYTFGEQVVVFLEEIEPDIFQSLSLAFSKFSLVEQNEVPVAVRTFDRGSLVDAPTGLRAPPVALGHYPVSVSIAELRAAIELAPTVVGALPAAL